MSEPAAASVCVATYNVHRCVGIDLRRSEARVAEVISTSGADLVGLQELSLRRARSGESDQAANIAQQLGWNVLFQPSLQNRREDFGDAIISRYPLRLVRAAELPGKGPWLCREPRVALWAEVETPLGPIHIMNTHLGLGRAERLLQAQWLAGPDWLASALPKTPLALVGDLNCLPGSRPYRQLTTCLRDVRESSARRTALRTFPTYLPLFAVDYILVNECLQLTNVRVHRTALARIASDHFPLVAELRKVSA
jgi:endonuclease/exonuclease/phosphatase family metal-dependent hydrolase